MYLRPGYTSQDGGAACPNNSSQHHNWGEPGPICTFFPAHATGLCRLRHVHDVCGVHGDEYSVSDAPNHTN